MYPAMGLKARTFEGGAKCARVRRLLDALAGHCEARSHWSHDERAICIPLVVAAACAPRERPMTTRRSIHIRMRRSPRSCACRRGASTSACARASSAMRTRARACTPARCKKQRSEYGSRAPRGALRNFSASAHLSAKSHHLSPINLMYTPYNAVCTPCDLTWHPATCSLAANATKTHAHLRPHQHTHTHGNTKTPKPRTRNQAHAHTHERENNALARAPALAPRDRGRWPKT